MSSSSEKIPEEKRTKPWDKPLPDCFRSLENFECDRLLPRETGSFVCEHANGHIIMKEAGIHELAEWLLSRFRNKEIDCLDYCAHELHPKTADRAAADWIFLMATVNFSLWTNKEYNIEVTYKDKTYTGYYAAAACINKALDAGIPVINPKFMQNMTVKSVCDIFQGNCKEGALVWALHKERTVAIIEAAKVLLTKFDGSFYNCIVQCEKSAVKLLAMIVENFPSYQDYAEYDGKKISFLRKAQILVAHIYYCFKGKNDIADFYDIDQLVVCDHRITQVLAFFLAFEYSPGLKQSLKTRPIFEIGDDIVLELRAISIKSVYDIADRIAKLRDETDEKLPIIYPIDVGTLLWHYRRENAEKVEAHIGFLRVRSIHY